ncbi:hypothetical protein [Roseovarius aestuarii]|uniref:Uncharacterized protein n=1 Tax=Roseovarius aestuarii TaxID=475083 RepID=A0A1X7BPW7_9RHOB|nr:hypothetical protein [Roseovarius aestuarii]SMC11259.1 hypothetical protein ROA7745_01071 [Roseovarius aestuarii]
MNQLTPPEGVTTYLTSDGLRFWMDYAKNGAPYFAPTIRTADPKISIVFIPGNRDTEEAYLLRYQGTDVTFSRPPASTHSHSDELDQLRNRNPGYDFVFSWIGREVDWVELADDDSGSRIHKIQSTQKFNSPEEQYALIDIFCELMSWTKHGAKLMALGGFPKNGFEFKKWVVGLDVLLKTTSGQRGVFEMSDICSVGRANDCSHF